MNRDFRTRVGIETDRRRGEYRIIVELPDGEIWHHPRVLHTKPDADLFCAEVAAEIANVLAEGAQENEYVEVEHLNR